MRLNEKIYPCLNPKTQKVNKVNGLTGFLTTSIYIYRAELKCVNLLTSLTHFQFLPFQRHLQRLKKVNDFYNQATKFVNFFHISPLNQNLSFFIFYNFCYNNISKVTLCIFFSLGENIKYNLIFSTNLLCSITSKNIFMKGAEL